MSVLLVLLLASRIETQSTFYWNPGMVASHSGYTLNLTMMTIPPKTKVHAMWLVITESARGPAVLTVSCGRTAPNYTDYLVAQDAKRAPLTPYGMNAWEKGIHQDGNDKPSETEYTKIVCQFRSFGAPLSRVRASAGRVTIVTSYEDKQ